MTTAAALIIGDEILTGKVRDTNGPALIDFLRGLGVGLRRLAYVGDEIDEIAEEVLGCSRSSDAVITSGGVGPTHDDCTVAAVARAFDTSVIRHPEIESMIRAYWGTRFTESALRMAEVPDGARLLYSDDGLLPLVVYQNVYLLPGIPSLFVAKLAALRGELEGTPSATRSLYLRSDESRIAPILGRVDDEFPAVKIGSYPRFDDSEIRIWISVEAADEARVSAAVARLLELLPSEEIVEIDGDG
jgi:molybdenum cofactor synthesis domain-containing protein